MIETGTARRANARLDICILSVSLEMSPNSELAESVRIPPSIFIARPPENRHTVRAFRLYRLTQTDLMGIERSVYPVTPLVWKYQEQVSPSLRSGPFLIKCSLFARGFPDCRQILYPGGGCHGYIFIRLYY